MIVFLIQLSQQNAFISKVGRYYQRPDVRSLLFVMSKLVSSSNSNKNHSTFNTLCFIFQDLPTGRISNWDIAKQSFNTPKNRYGNAVTCKLDLINEVLLSKRLSHVFLVISDNHSRVVLSGDEKTDYINASFINVSANMQVFQQFCLTLDNFLTIVFAGIG